MKNLLLFPAFAMTCLVAWKAPSPSTLPAPGGPTNLEQVTASGVFTQTGITSQEVGLTPRGLVIIDQESKGTVSGTMSGSYKDDLMVVIRPNGTFSASFTLEVDCTIDGKQGTLWLRAADVGQIISPETAVFSGVAVITSASGELSGTTGKLDIEGVVDLESELSIYTYEGTLNTAG